MSKENQGLPANFGNIGSMCRAFEEREAIMGVKAIQMRALKAEIEGLQRECDDIQDNIETWVGQFGHLPISPADKDRIYTTRISRPLLYRYLF